MPYDPEDVYRWYAAGVLGYLRARGADDPEDLLGEVFVSVARDLGRFTGDEDALRRWVFTLAHHRLIDARRSLLRRPRRAEGERVEDDLVLVEDPEPMPDQELVEALAQLTDEQREVLALRFVADLPLGEVARITERPVGAVKSLQHRALERLRAILASSNVV